MAELRTKKSRAFASIGGSGINLQNGLHEGLHFHGSFFTIPQALYKKFIAAQQQEVSGEMPGPV